MKLQFESQHLRIRVDEAEFSRLLTDQAVEASTTMPDMQFRVQLIAVADGAATLHANRDGITLHLPLPDLLAYQQRLPCRDGIAFSHPVAGGLLLQVAFEVDVRDSVRKRGPRRREPSA